MPELKTNYSDDFQTVRSAVVNSRKPGLRGVFNVDKSRLLQLDRQEEVKGKPG